MKRLLGKTFSLVVLAGLATVFAPACAENDQSIFIRTVLAPSINRQNGECIYTGDVTQRFQSEGLIDVAIRDTYTPTMLVGSQLFSRGDQPGGRSESNRTQLNGAVVRVTDPNGGQIGEFTSLASAFIDPQLNNIPTYSPFTVTLLDAKTTASIAQRVTPGNSTLVIANVKAFGRTLGGVDLESGEFQFPIRLCRGCLISFETGDDPATPGVDCNLPLTDQGAGSVLPCRAGQDEVTPCQVCRELDACKTR